MKGTALSRGARGLLLVLVIASQADRALPVAAADLASPKEGPGEGIEPGGTLPFRPLALDLRALSEIEVILPALARKQVVFVGESHDRFEHHLVQLEIIKGLHVVHPDLVIGMEQFQQPFQLHLDAYITGDINEKEMLRRTEYMERWRFDYRLYRPILEFARERRIPVLALNLPTEITNQVSRHGIAGLADADKAKIPRDIDRSDAAYRTRLREAFEQHPEHEGRDFERFVEVQLVWDEGMAERAAEHLRAHSSRRMVVLAGSGHLAHGSGIPQRLRRRLAVDYAIVLNAGGWMLAPEVADFLVMPPERKLAPAGKLGILMEGADDGVKVSGFASKSAAAAAGMQQGDRVVALDGEAVHTPADLRIALLDKRPGDAVEVAVRRRARLGRERALTLRIKLQ